MFIFFLLILKFKHLHESLKVLILWLQELQLLGLMGMSASAEHVWWHFLVAWADLGTLYHGMGTAVKQPWMVHFWIKVWSYLSFWSLVSVWSRWSKNYYTAFWHGCLPAGVTRNHKPFIACSLLKIIFISTSILKTVNHFKNNERLILFKRWHFFSHDAIYSHTFSSIFGPGQDPLERLCI